MVVCNQPAIANNRSPKVAETLIAISIFLLSRFVWHGRMSTPRFGGSMRAVTSSEHAKAIPGYPIDAFVSSLDGEMTNPRSRSNYRNALRAVERVPFRRDARHEGNRLWDRAGRQGLAALRVRARHGPEPLQRLQVVPLLVRGSRRKRSN